MWRKADSETTAKRREREITQPWHPKTRASYRPRNPRPDTSPEQQLSLDWGRDPKRQSPAPSTARSHPADRGDKP